MAGGLCVGLILGVAIFLFAANPAINLFDNSGEFSLQSGAPRIGQPVPQFSAEWINGGSFDQDILLEKKTVLNFWATWCAPCRQEMPIFQSAYEQYRPEIQVIGLNAGESATEIREFLDEFGIDFDIAIDIDGSVQGQFAVLGLPITFFIDEQGMLIAQHIGGVTEQQMDGYLKLLGVNID